MLLLLLVHFPFEDSPCELFVLVANHTGAFSHGRCFPFCGRLTEMVSDLVVLMRHLEICCDPPFQFARDILVLPIHTNKQSRSSGPGHGHLFVFRVVTNGPSVRPSAPFKATRTIVCLCVLWV